MSVADGRSAPECGSPLAPWFGGRRRDGLMIGSVPLQYPTRLIWRHEVVTHVLGTTCHLCVRAGQRTGWLGRRDSNLCILDCNSPKTPSQGVRIRTSASWNRDLSSGPRTRTCVSRITAAPPALSKNIAGVRPTTQLVATMKFTRTNFEMQRFESRRSDRSVSP